MARIGSHPALNSGHIGVPGFGVFGSDIPATGADGPAYLYPSLSLPGDADKQYLAISASVITGLDATLDSSFEYSGIPASFEFDVWEDGVNIGSADLIFQIGIAASISESDTTETDTITATVTEPSLSVTASMSEADTAEVDSISADVDRSVSALLSESDTTEIDSISANANSPELSVTSVISESDTAEVDAIICSISISVASSIGESDTSELDSIVSLIGGQPLVFAVNPETNTELPYISTNINI